MARRIKHAKITFVSLVPRGANTLPVIYKSDDTFTLDFLTKAPEGFAEKGELLAVVYAPEIRDSQGDIASADVIKHAAYDAMQSGFNIDLKHNEQALRKDQAAVVESFIIQKADARFADMKNYSGAPVDVTGGWAVVIKIFDEAIRKEYREGKWNGVSMFGRAAFESEDTPAKKTETNGDFNMTAAELAAELAKSNQTLITDLVKALKPEAPAPAAPVVKADEKPAKKERTFVAPIFKGEQTLDNIRRHRLTVKKAAALFELEKTDLTDEQETDLYKQVADIDAAIAELPAVEETKKSDEETKKSDEGKGGITTNTPTQPVAKGGITTNTPTQPVAKDGSAAKGQGVNSMLSKAEQDLIKEAQEDAATLNTKRGYGTAA